MEQKDSIVHVEPVKALILIAHGSRLAASNAEIRALTQELHARVGDRFAYASCAFLELAEPSIASAIDAAVQAGSEDITLLPYFLARGAHVSEHIPGLVAAKQLEYPSIELHLMPYVGASPGMVELLAAAL
jgi:sirohydrochlorin ferrochelatase